MMDELYEQLRSGNFVATMDFPGGVQEHIFVKNLVLCMRICWLPNRLAIRTLQAGKRILFLTAIANPCLSSLGRL